MRVLFSCNAATGHFHPMLPLASALREAGHDVAFCTGTDFGPAIEAAGFTLLPAGPGLMELAGATMERFPDAPLATPAEQQRFAFELMFSDVRIELTVDAAAAAAREFRPEVIVNEIADFVGPLVAARLGIPNATVGVGLLPTELSLGLAAQGAARHWEAAGLSPRADAGLYGHLYLNQWPLPLQHESLRDLPNVQPLRPVPFGAGSELPADLAAVGLERPLVYVTFGTVFGQPARFDAVLDALAGFDADVVVTVGPDGDPDAIGARLANVHIRRFVPQGALLPRCALVVTHGGAGSVIGPLVHGVPLVVTPEGADQEENGLQVEHAGVGRMVLPGDDFAARVHAAANAMLDGGATQRAAKRLAADIAAMPSPRDCVAVVEQLTS